MNDALVFQVCIHFEFMLQTLMILPLNMCFGIVFGKLTCYRNEHILFIYIINDISSNMNVRFIN